MNQPNSFDRNRLSRSPNDRAAWNASFEPVLAELRESLQTRLPAVLAARAGAEWDAGAGELRLAWQGTGYRITWPALVTYRTGVAEPSPANIQGLFLYYLSMADGAPEAGAWISFRELPDGWLYHQAFQGYTGQVLVRELGDNWTRLADAAVQAGGVPIGVSDCGYGFQVLPQVKLAVVYWRGDEEFPAQAQVLFDAAASHYLPIDGLAMVASYLVQKLLKLAAPSPART